ncbi:hypothetical protein CHS0354_018929 [Potamilus streckersoni]|uniref:DDB1- and CUL4-associated factor 11 n=1 Tax=Potamilus streckersoni TaxID=2493646 RepID=A0AAE0RN10_9BIVA|nr:hypothetical protein CHS0354_018929 [Potamilus streckersoni]
MGSFGSRQARMSNRVDISPAAGANSTIESSRSPPQHLEEEEIQEQEDSETDLPAILAYLIRSGQVRILTNDGEGDCSDGDEEFCGTARLPQADPHPDISNIETNDIYHEIMKKSGRWRKDKSYTRQPTVTHLLYKRQIGLPYQKKFTPGDCCVMSIPFLPNRLTRVANFRNKAFCGIYSKDGKIFLSSSQDQFIRIYDTSGETFDLTKEIRARDIGWSVLDTAFSPDGNYLAYSSWSDCIHICNVFGDSEIHHALPLFPTESSFCIFSLIFSMDNRDILGGANDGCLYVFDRESNQRSLKIEAHDDDVNTVAFAGDSSNILFSGGDDGLCKVWDRRTLQESHPVPVGMFAGHSDGITYIDSKGDARYLISNSKDQTIKLWDIRCFSTSEGIEATKKTVAKQRWDYRWQQVPRKLNRKNKLQGDSSIMTYRGHSVLHTLIRCRFSPEFSTSQRFIYSGCATGSVVIYDLLSGKIVKKLERHRSCVRDVSWHPYENNIISTSWDGCLGKWDYQYIEVSNDEDSDTSESETDGTGGVRHSLRLRTQRRQKTKKQRVHECEEWRQGLFD